MNFRRTDDLRNEACGLALLATRLDRLKSFVNLQIEKDAARLDGTVEILQAEYSIRDRPAFPAVHISIYVSSNTRGSLHPLRQGGCIGREQFVKWNDTHASMLRAETSRLTMKRLIANV